MKRSGLISAALLWSAGALARRGRGAPAEHAVPARRGAHPGGRQRALAQRGYHSLWFQAEGLAESAPLFPGERWQRRFDRPGRYEYLCAAHPQMRGGVTVEP